jgi:hypothetical protein
MPVPRVVSKQFRSIQAASIAFRHHINLYALEVCLVRNLFRLAIQLRSVTCSLAEAFGWRLLSKPAPHLTLFTKQVSMQFLD